MNLFIGMILDNFSFITDDVAVTEDDQWSSGASANQIKACAQVAYTPRVSSVLGDRPRD